MNSRRMIFLAVGLLMGMLLSSDADAQATPLLFQGFACPKGQMLTDGTFIVAGNPGRGTLNIRLAHSDQEELAK
jgi:hypothetical protein